MTNFDWPFLIMNLAPFQDQLDRLLVRLFPATVSDGYQSVSTTDSPALPESLRYQLTAQKNCGKLIHAQPVLKIRYHVKLLLSLGTFVLLCGILILIPPFLLFVALTTILGYVLLICSYTALTSWLVITTEAIIVASPSWRYRWLVHLNYILPFIAGVLSSKTGSWQFSVYPASAIRKLDIDGFKDGSCKMKMDAAFGIHQVNDLTLMDHFADCIHIRNAVSTFNKALDEDEGEAAVSSPIEATDQPVALDSSGSTNVTHYPSRSHED